MPQRSRIELQKTWTAPKRLQPCWPTAGPRALWKWPTFSPVCTSMSGRTSRNSGSSRTKSRPSSNRFAASAQRWHHWIQFYDQQRHSEEPRKIWQLPKGLKTAKTKAGQPDGRPLSKSVELQNVLKNAEELSPARDFVDGRAIPILTCECVLLAIAKKTDSELGHRLVATGLNVISLEESARNPKHAPKH